MTIGTNISKIYYHLKELILSRLQRTEVAPSFNSSSSYTVGQMVIYNNTLYRCINSHTGAWSSSDFTTTTVSECIGNNVKPFVHYTSVAQEGDDPTDIQETIKSNTVVVLTVVGEQGGFAPTSVHLNLDAQNGYSREFTLCIISSDGTTWNGKDSEGNVYLLVQDNHYTTLVDAKIHNPTTNEDGTVADYILNHIKYISESGSGETTQNYFAIKFYEISPGIFGVIPIDGYTT